MAKDLTFGALLDCYGAVLHEKPRLLMEYYYNDDLSLAEIAENTGMTRQGVHDALKRAEAQLTEYEALLQVCARTRELKTLAQNCRNDPDGAALRALLDCIDSL